jgi:hypothetical protein
MEYSRPSGHCSDTPAQSRIRGLMLEANVDRTYLYVPPEEKAEVEALGARWDERSKCWYIGSDESAASFSKWLPDDDAIDEDFTITSDRAHVASATVLCWQCRAMVEVICIYCENGIVSDEPLEQFTVSDIWGMDSALARQLEPWAFFKSIDDESGFANHCPHCDALQDDTYLHCEPDQPFFNIPRAAPGSIVLTALVGRIQLSGNESFEA